MVRWNSPMTSWASRATNNRWRRSHPKRKDQEKGSNRERVIIRRCVVWCPKKATIFGCEIVIDRLFSVEKVCVYTIHMNAVPMCICRWYRYLLSTRHHRLYLQYSIHILGIQGMCASSQPLASAIGARILQAGGNAADAAVAMAAALNLLEPCSTGIGGDAFALFYNAQTKQVHCLQGNGAAAGQISLEVERFLISYTIIALFISPLKELSPCSVFELHGYWLSYGRIFKGIDKKSICGVTGRGFVCTNRLWIPTRHCV